MLDPRGKKEIIDLVHLLRINQKDLTIFSITHDPEEAYLSDKVLVIDQGKIKYYDTPKNVFSHYDELVNMGLDIPFEMKIKNLLIKENIDVSKVTKSSFDIDYADFFNIEKNFEFSYK